MSRMVTSVGNSREYETIYIMRPDIDAESAEKVGTRLSEVVDREKGKLTKPYRRDAEPSAYRPTD